MAAVAATATEPVAGRLGALGRRAVSEMRSVLPQRGARFPLVAAGLTAAVAGLAALQSAGIAPGVLEQWSAEKAALPFGHALQRLPLSMVAPAPNLPVWGALAQVFVVFAVAEWAIGPVPAVGVALGAHAAATLAGRAMITLGPDHLLGVDRALGAVRDTGPSVAVVALAVYVGARRRASG